MFGSVKPGKKIVIFLKHPEVQKKKKKKKERQKQTYQKNKTKKQKQNKKRSIRQKLGTFPTVNFCYLIFWDESIAVGNTTFFFYLAWWNADKLKLQTTTKTWK